MIRQTIFGFKLEKTDETLTAHGGLAFFGEYNRGMGLRELVNKHLPAPGSNRGYAPSTYVESIVLMLQGGGRHLEDMRELERESALMKLMGLGFLPDPDSAGDWLRRMGDTKNGQSGLHGLGRVRDAVNQRIMRREKISAYTLDADATLISGEKRDALMSYKGVVGYMPMLGFLFENGVCLLDEFRDGNVSPGAGQAAFYRECKMRMPEGKRIGAYRADSASYVAELINELEADKAAWAITADQDTAVKALIGSLPETDWKEPEAGCGFWLAETVHTMNKTDKAFRLVVKRWVKEREDLFETPENPYAYHAVASNWTQDKKDAKDVLKWHNQRGEAENFNKELKNGFGMEQMPCGGSSANAVFFRIGAIAYNLFMGFKRLSSLEGWERHTIATFRWKLIQVAGRIVRHAGRVVLRLCVNSEELTRMTGIRRECCGLAT